MPSPIGEFPRSKLDLASLHFSLEIQGDYVQLKSHRLETLCVQRARRGVISGFSRASRLRMLSMIARMDWRTITKGLFVTLTFPDEKLPNSKDDRNRYRYLFLRSMENHLGTEVGALWRCEWQIRKSGTYRGKLCPHFHLVIPGVKYVAWQTIRKWWGQALGYRGHLATDVRRLSNRRMHEVYIAKYCAKVAASSSLDYVSYLNSPGRQWGVHRPELLPFHQKVEFDEVGPQTVDVLRRLASNLLPYYSYGEDAGFRLFGLNGRSVADTILRLALDDGACPRYTQLTKGK